MVVKTVYGPSELEKLVPQWPILNPNKVKRISRLKTKSSKLIPDKRITVIASPAILITDTGFVLNGKHR